MSNIGFATINIQGRLTEDPEFKTLENGRDMCRFRVAVNRRFGDNEKTHFIPVTVFGSKANNCYQYLSRGRWVYVVADFETDRYEAKDGSARTGFGAVVDDNSGRVDFGSGGRKDEDTSASTETNTGYSEGTYSKGSYGKAPGSRDTSSDMREYLNSKKRKRTR